MALASGKPKAKLAKRTVILACCSAALYAGVFSHSAAIVRLFAKGGMYAALPLLTVIVFSFVHGAFASNLWSLLGISPRKTMEKRAQPTRAKRPARPDTRPRLKV